ncbi:trigger factor, partial [Nocardiopsis tropica]|nr:trigger factor [Nocardiopsis tropica]
HLVESNQIRVAFTEVVRGKAMDLVLAGARVTDEDGNVIEQENAEETAAKAAAVAAEESLEVIEDDAEETGAPAAAADEAGDDKSEEAK